MDKRAKYVTLSENILKSLILDAKCGDQDAYELILKSFQPYIASICSEFCSSVIDEDDITQEANMGIMDAVRYFNSAIKDTPSRFIKRHVRIRVVNFAEKQEEKYVKPYGDIWDLQDIVSNQWFYIDEFEDDIACLREVYELAKSFPPNHRITLLLWVYGWSFEEIGNFIGKSTSSVGVYAKEIREKIRERAYNREYQALYRLGVV